MSYEFIVCTINEERYKLMSNLFKYLNISNVTFLEASTPDNSKEYLQNYLTHKHAKLICSTRTHIRALKHCTEGHYDFSIILEDDVTFLNNYFIDSINELISNCDLYASYGHKMISIGWVPLSNYSKYQNLESQFKNLTSIPNCKLINQIFCPGLQGYIVKKSHVIKHIDYMFQPTFNDFYNKIITDSKLTDILKVYNKPINIETFIVLDNFLNFYFNQILVFPPLLIETDIVSTVGNKNKELYWDKFFNNFEKEKCNYFNSVYMEPLLITYCNSDINNTNNKTNNFIRTLKNNNWNYVILGRSDKWINFVESRTKTYLNYLKQIKNHNQIVVLSDARDVFCVRNSKKFIDSFKKYNKKIIVSMEIFSEGLTVYDSNKEYFQVTFIENYWKFNNIDYNQISKKFVNNGLIAGYIEDLINCFQWIIDNKFTDDQKGMGAYINNFPELFYADIDSELLHTDCSFVNGGCSDENIQNNDSTTLLELTGSKSYFLHIPGLIGSKGQSYIYEVLNTLIETLNQTKKITLYPHYKNLLL
jgi:hypothetical protein